MSVLHTYLLRAGGPCPAAFRKSPPCAQPMGTLWPGCPLVQFWKVSLAAASEGSAPGRSSSLAQGAGNAWQCRIDLA